MNVLLVGAPGSGKGTQSQILISKKNFKHISTGDIFRFNLKNKTELGLMAQKYMEDGLLVPDEVTIKMVEDYLKKIPSDQNLIFDGFPRNLEQAQAFDEMLKNRSQKLDHVIYLDVPDKEIVHRLSGRYYAPKSGLVYNIYFNPPKVEGKCDQTGEDLIRRKDDQEDLVLERLKVFQASTFPILKHYEKQGLMRKIEANKPPEAIFEEILSHIG